MNTFKIPVVSIGDGGCAFEECVRVETIQPPNTRALTIETVSVVGQFTRMGDEYLFRGHIRGAFSGACSRCLTPTQAPIEVEVTWVFAEGPDAVFEEIGRGMEMDEETILEETDDLDTRRAFQGPTINLATYVWEEIVFATPSRYLCSETCRGLCQNCGVNLNEEQCNCAAPRREEPIGNRGLAGLAKLFPDLASDTIKE